MIGTCGHFGYEKGLDVVLQTFRRLLDSIENCSLKLLILGNGSSERRAVLEDLASPCEGRVAFLGYRADVHRLFQAFDIFLHAPRQEAFGLVVTEAMATGLPVVATRAGGIPEIIDDGITGRLAAPESPPQLADAVRELIDTPTMRSEMATSARRRASTLYCTTSGPARWSFMNSWLQNRVVDPVSGRQRSRRGSVSGCRQ